MTLDDLIARLAQIRAERPGRLSVCVRAWGAGGVGLAHDVRVAYDVDAGGPDAPDPAVFIETRR